MRPADLLGAFTASAQEKISLQKALDLTLERNLTIKQSAFTEALDDATLQQSKNNRLPSLSATVQSSENFGRALDVNYLSIYQQSQCVCG
jgi:outer membrane protein